MNLSLQGLEMTPLGTAVVFDVVTEIVMKSSISWVTAPYRSLNVDVSELCMLSYSI
jgi:hypothetical protein